MVGSWIPTPGTQVTLLQEANISRKLSFFTCIFWIKNLICLCRYWVLLLVQAGKCNKALQTSTESSNKWSHQQKQRKQAVPISVQSEKRPALSSARYPGGLTTAAARLPQPTTLWPTNKTKGMPMNAILVIKSALCWCRSSLAKLKILAPYDSVVDIRFSQFFFFCNPPQNVFSGHESTIKLW